MNESSGNSSGNSQRFPKPFPDLSLFPPKGERGKGNGGKEIPDRERESGNREREKSQRRVKGMRSHYEIGAEIVATLMHGPRPWPDVEEQAGLAGATSENWKRELRASGVLRICGYRKHESGLGAAAAIYELQKPFEHEDVVKPGVRA